jgi:hypothetical protein
MKNSDQRLGLPNLKLGPPNFELGPLPIKKLHKSGDSPYGLTAMGLSPLNPRPFIYSPPFAIKHKRNIRVRKHHTDGA